MAKNKSNGENKSEKFFNTLLEYLLDFIIVVSSDGKIKYVSPSFYNSLGYSMKETIGQFVFLFIHPDDISKTKEEYKVLLAKPGTLQNVTIRLLRKDGKVVFVKGSRKNLLDDPEIEGIILTGKDVTEITEANLSLDDKNEMLEIQQRLLSVTELISKVGGWEYDVITQKMFWTEEVYRIHDINKNDFEAGSTNHIDKSVECYLPEDRQKILEAFNKCVNKAEPYDLVFPFVTCNGKSLWVRTVAKPVIENNKVVKIIGNIADVTREKRAELLSEARYRLIEFSYHSKLDEFLQKVLDEAETLTQSKIGFYHFVEADQITLSLQAWSTNTIEHMCKAEGKGLHYDIDKAGVWVDCVHNQKTIVHNDYESLTHKKGLPEGHAPVIREVVVPVFREDKIVAILGVGNKNNFYDDDDVEMITKLADFAWDITERKRTEKALDESELKYKRIIETSNEGIWMMDADYKTTFVNKRMANQLEYTVEEMIGKKVYDFMFEEDLVDHRNKMDSRKKGIGELYERRFKKKNGGELWTIVSATSLLSDDKRFLGSFAMFTDITDRKNSEMALLESEKKYRLLFDASPIGIGISDMNGKIIKSNPVMKEITGYDFENEKDVVVSDMYVHKENRETLLILLSKNGCARDWEVDLKRKDGSIYNALINVDVIQTGNEKFILTNMRDISNRKRAEKVLKENEELKQTVLDSLNANVAVVDSKGNIISVNKPWEKFALSNGIKKLDGTVEKINYFDVLCRSVENGEKNADKVFEGIKSVLNGEKEYFETEYPCDSPSEKRWFVMHVLPLVNESGVVISHENITERKIAEDQLRQSEETLKLLNIMQQDQNAELIEKNNELKKARLSTLNIIEDLSREIREHKLAEEKLKANEQKFKTVADFTYDWEYWEGKNNEIIYMSPSCQRITGYTREDFIANSSLMERIIVPEDAFKFITHHHDIVLFDKRDEVEELEFSIVHKNGSIKNIFHICRPIFDENKKYLGRRVSNRDVSEKKQIEIELRNSEAKYHELYSLLRLMSDTMPDMLWAKDLDKKFLFTNKAICENLLMANDTDEPIGKTDLFFAERQRRLHSENPEWHTFGELCQDSDLITIKEMKHKQFDEFGNVKGKFLYLDVHKAPLINDNGELIGTVGSARNITEPKAAEKALKESESRNRAFLNAIPDLIFIISQDGIFIDYKSEREELLLIPPENFVGKHIREVLPEKLVLLTLEKIGLLFATGEVQVYDYSLEQNGQIKHYENRLVLSGDNQILSIIRDITSAKESEVQIKRLSHAIEQSKATIIITSVTGNIEYFNPMLTEITGYTFEELKGKSISILGSGNGNDKTEQEMWNTISNGKDWSGEFLNKKKNGELYWSSAVVSPIKDNKDEIVNFIAIQEDITHQKQLTKELIEAKEKAEEMNKVKSYFFANMSHELRTPFVGILGFSEMLAEAIPDPELKNYAEQILKSSKRLTDTLNKILNITRLEFDKYEPDTTDVNVNAVLEELTSLYLQTSKNNNTTIKTNLLFDNALIKSDKKLIEEIFTNLISNAVKYTPNGSIEITSRNVVSDNKNILEIIVADTGMGISENMQDIIWQEFRQASEGYSRSFEGTGLGLTITKKYVEILGGKISLKSKLGEGSTFKVQIPFTFSDVKPKVDSNTIKKLPEVILENDVRKPRLLYVEDDAISLNYITIVLKSKYEISTAFSAKIALELVNTNQYDALMLDINLGRGMDGLELMLKIRQIDNYKEIPIVAVTAYAADSDKAEFLAKGFNQYLSKPFTASELTDMLKKVLE